MTKDIVPEIDHIAPKKTTDFKLTDISDPQGIKDMGDLVAAVASTHGLTSIGSPGKLTTKDVNIPAINQGVKS